MADGAVKQGVPRQMALQFAAQTVLGAAKTVLQTEKHPAVLRDEVCSTIHFRKFHPTNCSIFFCLSIFVGLFAGRFNDCWSA